MGEQHKTFVLGLPLHVVSDYPDWLARRIQAHQATHVVTLNSEMAIQARDNPNLAKVIDQAELVVPDGAGVVLYLRLRGQHIERHPGIEIAEALLQKAASEQWSVFFYGSQPDVVQRAAEHWQHKFPGLKIAGFQHGYLNQDEVVSLLQTLTQLQPEIVLVGLGVPRQEFWINQHRDCCPNAVWIGVGGSFDIWAGTKIRAPRWLRDNNLEWMYRLYQEPHRWRRMLALPRFAWEAFFGA